MRAIVLSNRFGNKGETIELSYTENKEFYKDKKDQVYHLSEFVNEEDIEIEIENSEKRIRHHSNKLEVLRKIQTE